MTMSSTWRKSWRHYCLCLGLLAPLALGAQNFRIQPKTNAPYSRFGLGDPSNNYFVAQSGMGGLGVAFVDAAHTNWVNPASFTSLDATALEMGIQVRSSSLQEEGRANSNILSGNLNYFSLAFPLNNRINQALERRRSKFDWGMGLALAPRSTVGYNVETLTELPEIGPAKNILKGSGGVYNVKWANAWRFNNLSVGIEAAALFGKTINSRRVDLDSLRQSYSVEIQDDISYGGITWKAGLQYTFNFDPINPQGQRQVGHRSLVVGGFWGPNNRFNTLSSSLNVRVIPIDGSRTFVDTVSIQTDLRRNGTLPSEWGIGFLYQSLAKFQFGAEYTAGQWSNYRNEAKPESLRNNWRAAVGLEYIPNILSYNSLSAKSRYRAGLFYGTDPRAVNGEQIQHYGVTLGLGLPIIRPRQTISYVNLALEAGRFGITDNIRETYIQFSFGLTLNDDSWFFKRKFN